jgi:hypothetical protein
MELAFEECGAMAQRWISRAKQFTRMMRGGGMERSRTGYREEIVIIDEVNQIQARRIFTTAVPCHCPSKAKISIDSTARLRLFLP